MISRVRNFKAIHSLEHFAGAGFAMISALRKIWKSSLMSVTIQYDARHFEGSISMTPAPGLYPDQSWF